MGRFGPMAAEVLQRPELVEKKVAATGITGFGRKQKIRAEILHPVIVDYLS
ncbi:hypothetical protein OROHE_003462 [Orobanche hederae]